MTIPAKPDKTTARDPEGTRGKILDAAMDVFANKGYHDASVDEIVEASGTSKGSVYFHFPNKQKLFLALLDKFADLLERRILEAIAHEETPVRRASAALEAFMSTFGKYRPFAKILLIQAVGLGSAFEEKRLQVYDRFAALVKTYLDQAVREGDIAPIDTNIAAYAWMGAINEVVIRWVYTGQPDPNRILSALRPMLLRSVGFSEESL
ncbi:MAG: TetR/AcrR family transcriptional regulator [Anaerolineae bacterium]